MGCICVKPAVPTQTWPGLYPVGPGADKLGSSFKNPSGIFDFERGSVEDTESCQSKELRKLKKGSCNERSSVSVRLGLSRRFTEAETTAAGWPAWLSTIAAEAIQGWIPLKADSFEKLEKIGQGTYSSVFRAKELETGRMVALKKVRFDNFQAESIRFMSREIMILRQLDHPNIMKLEGIITSRLSSTLYLVFEYMEHDLAGLVSCPDIKFSEAQVKCYMKQLLMGVEHCHQHGIIHRDIKTSNILVNNKGILKLGDFGLANMLSSKQLTSRVVTLWYRPPELLMGSTNYGVSVDLWSVGCVFAELLLGKPLLKGRTEVEQLHKIFKLCGTPPDEFWRMSRIPQGTMIKPQHYYESSLRERFKDSPSSSVYLLETFLSVEPHRRGTASSALTSEYFRTPPYACEPSSLPKYHPNKEIDAKNREEARRKKTRPRLREPEALKKPTRICKALHEQNNIRKLVPKEGVSNNHHPCRNNPLDANGKEEGVYREPQKPSLGAVSGILEVTESSQRQSIFSGPIPVSSSSGFAWAKRQKEEAALKRSYSRSSSRSQVSAVDSSCITFEPSTNGQHGFAVREMHHDSFDASEFFCSQDFSLELNRREKQDITGFCGNRDPVDFSGPVLSQTQSIEELLLRNENHIRRAARRAKLDQSRLM